MRGPFKPNFRHWLRTDDEQQACFMIMKKKKDSFVMLLKDFYSFTLLLTSGDDGD